MALASGVPARDPRHWSVIDFIQATGDRFEFHDVEYLYDQLDDDEWVAYCLDWAKRIGWPT